jgi:hypothetical protein
MEENRCESNIEVDIEKIQIDGIGSDKLPWLCGRRK